MTSRSDARDSPERTLLSDHSLGLPRPTVPPAPAWSPRRLPAHVRRALPQGASLPEALWWRRHRAILGLLWLHVPGIALFGVLADAGLAHALGESTFVALFAVAATVAGRRASHRQLLSTLVALGLLTSSATIVHLSGGVVEAHFHFFVIMSVLLLYEDWLPYATALGYVVLHHGVLGSIDAADVYNHTAGIEHPWRWAGVHALFIAAAGAANVINWRLNETARVDARAAFDRAQLSDARFAVAFANAPIGVALVAPDGRWLDVNRALVEITGYTREQLLEMSFQMITHPDDLVADLGLAERVFRGELESYEMEKRYFHADGHVIWVQLDVAIVRDAAGAPQYFISQIQDITKRRQLEEQFRQSQKMEAVGQLAGGVAHDFNNLLTVISGYSELALQRVDDGVSRANRAELLEELGEIRDSAARAASLTQQLLAFSRRQVVRPGVVDVNELVTAMEKLLHRLLGEEIELVVELDPAVGPVVADPGQLEQVVLNLAVNGRDAMPHGGALTIATSTVTLAEALASEHGRIEPGRYTAVSVRDGGSGLSPEIRAHMFEPFFTTKEPGKGTGLGLSTVYGILEQNGGHVRIDSAPGRGTTFEIYLPQAEATAETEPGPVGPDTVGAAETVLLVEDEASVRDLASRMLERSGYRVLAAANGHEALELCTEHREQLDLMVTDVVMPEMRGGELARRVADLCPGLPVLYMSGYTDDSIDPAVSQSRAFLQKPFTLVEFLDAVRTTMDSAAA